jgi:hypothetical protein
MAELPVPELIGNVEVYRKDGMVLLIREGMQCNHKDIYGDYVRHVHYYVTTDRPTRELERLIEWLEAGFWWDSFCFTKEPIIRRFLAGECMGNAHFL